MYLDICLLYNQRIHCIYDYVCHVFQKARSPYELWYWPKISSSDSSLVAILGFASIMYVHDIGLTG